jgi:putative membrane protein
VTISGGDTTVLWHCVLALAGFALVSLALLWLVVSRQRVWSMARLKPELELLPGPAGHHITRLRAGRHP